MPVDKTQDGDRAEVCTLWVLFIVIIIIIIISNIPMGRTVSMGLVLVGVNCGPDINVMLSCQNRRWWEEETSTGEYNTDGRPPAYPSPLAAGCMMGEVALGRRWGHMPTARAVKCRDCNRAALKVPKWDDTHKYDLFIIWLYDHYLFVYYKNHTQSTGKKLNV